MDIPFIRPDRFTPRNRSRRMTSLARVPVSDVKNKVEGVSVINPGEEAYCAKNANQEHSTSDRKHENSSILRVCASPAPTRHTATVSSEIGFREVYNAAEPALI